MKTLVPFLSGAIFGLGLLLSGMTDRLRVRAFLDVLGHWDHRLLFVMAFAIAVFAPVFHLRKRRAVGEAATAVYALPSAPVIDAPLVVGAILFGIGWGIVGFCPGPAVLAAGAALVRLDRTPLVFGAAMLVGMGLHTLYARSRARREGDDG